MQRRKTREENFFTQVFRKNIEGKKRTFSNDQV